MATIRILQWFAPLCLLGILPPLVPGCTLERKPPERLGLAAMFSRAPYVVHATGVGKNDTGYLVVMKVYCLFKPNMILAPNLFPDTTYVHNFVYPDSCLLNPDYEVGVGYVMALVKYCGDPIPGFEQAAIFDSYQPDVLQTNIYKVDIAVLQDTLNVCGLAPSDVGMSSCPVGSVGDRQDDCAGTTSVIVRSLTTQDDCDRVTSLVPSLIALSAAILVVRVMVDV